MLISVVWFIFVYFYFCIFSFFFIYLFLVFLFFTFDFFWTIIIFIAFILFFFYFLIYFVCFCIFVPLVLYFLSLVYLSSSEINRFKHLRLRCSRFYNHLNFLLRCKRSRVIPKFINIRYNLHPTFRVNKALIRSKLAILRAVTQDVMQSIASVDSELYSLHLHLSNSIPNFSSFEKKIYFYVEF